VKKLTDTGEVVPTNLDVAFKDFLQPGNEPAHAQVFTTAQRSIRWLPLGVDWAKLQTRVAPQVQALLTQPVLDDLATMLDDIDQESRSVLDPDYEPSEPPSGSPSGSSSESATEPGSDSIDTESEATDD
jgi:multiple sugar transport system substrate-binding protein